MADTTTRHVLSELELLRGEDAPPPPSTGVRAGALSARVEGAELRDVRIGEVELARRVYVAVRDHNWDTAPMEVTDHRVEVEADRFRATFSVQQVLRAVRLRWRGVIEGGADGAIRYTMDGEAESDFRFNKIGFNVHHPLRESTGRPYRARTEDREVRGVLPELIEPQHYLDGIPTAMFEPYDHLVIEIEEGMEARFTFEGDLFEMQDHRNWTDGNFKTYCTPCLRGFPMDAVRGQRFRQAVELSVGGGSPRPESSQVTTTLRVGGAPAAPMPRIGLGAPSHVGPHTARESELLAALGPDHLRVDADLSAGDGEAGLQQLRAGLAAARDLRVAVELGLTLEPATLSRLDELGEELGRAGVEVARVLVYDAREKSTPGSLVEAARRGLSAAVPGAPFAGGTNAYFAEINRDRPQAAAMDAVAYSINPQVHAFDEASLVETLPAQADTVRSTQAFTGRLPVFVSPVTLRARFNPNATGPEPEPEPGELPAQVDPRQVSLFAAAWTVGSIKSLATAGAASATYFETTGWRGVIDRDEGSPLPERFRSPGAVAFPVYHALADVLEGAPGRVVPALSSDPQRAEVLMLDGNGVRRALVVNLSAEPHDVELIGVPGGPARVRRLNVDTAGAAMERPLEFRGGGEPLEVAGGELRLRLGAYELIRIDWPA